MVTASSELERKQLQEEEHAVPDARACPTMSHSPAHRSPAGRLSIPVPIQSVQGEVWLSQQGCVLLSALLDVLFWLFRGLWWVPLEQCWCWMHAGSGMSSMLELVGWGGRLWWELVTHGTSTAVLADRSRRPRISGKQGSSLGPGKLVLPSGAGAGCDSVNQALLMSSLQCSGTILKMSACFPQEKWF